MAQNQFDLLGQRRFLPYFATQALGAFNDNVYRQAIIGLLFFSPTAAFTDYSTCPYPHHCHSHRSGRGRSDACAACARSGSTIASGVCGFSGNGR
jgi:hypothetical protein